MGLGTEFLFIIALGALVLGPQQAHALLQHVAKVKAQFETASRGFKSQLAAELDAANEGAMTDNLHESGGKR